MAVERWTLIGMPLGDSPLVGGPEVAEDQEIQVVPASDYDRLLSACKEWRDVRRDLFNRGDELVKAEADLVAVIQSLEGEGR